MRVVRHRKVLKTIRPNAERLPREMAGQTAVVALEARGRGSLVER
jgi:hypothetical protein